VGGGGDVMGQQQPGAPHTDSILVR
jgi:hypothetical protein